MDFKKSVLSGTFWSSMQIGSDRAISFLFLVVLARLLSPEDFGVAALAMSFVELGLFIVRAGVPEVIIQRNELSAAQADTAFWTNLLAGSIVVALTLTAAGPLSSLFGLPLLDPILTALSVVYIAGALGAVPEGRLKRQFRFRA